MDTKNGVVQQMLEEMSIDELNRFIKLLQSYRTERLGTKAEVAMNKEDRVHFLESKAVELLMGIGVPQHLLGFDYLAYALVTVAEDKGLLYGGITKRLYPKIADEFKTTSNRVERAIRHAIECAWDRNIYIEDRDELFGNSISATKGKPVNSEFIATLSNTLNRAWEKYINR